MHARANAPVAMVTPSCSSSRSGSPALAGSTCCWGVVCEAPPPIALLCTAVLLPASGPVTLTLTGCSTTLLGVALVAALVLVQGCMAAGWLTTARVKAGERGA